MFLKKYNFSFLIVEILFFIFFYLFVLHWIKPELIYFIQQPIFLTDNKFLLDYLKYPGGFSEYFSGFLLQFYCFPKIGALIITATAVGLTFITGVLLNQFEVKKINLILKLIPSLMLISLYNHPRYLMVSGIILLISLVFVYAYLKIPELSSYLRICILFISSVLLFFLCGGMAVIFFCFNCLIIEIYSKNKVNKAIILLSLPVIAVLVPYLLTRLFYYITYHSAYFHLFIKEADYKPPVLLFYLYAWYPPLILFVLTFKKFRFFKTDNPDKNASVKSNTSNLIALVIQSVLVLIIFIVTVKYSTYKEQKLINEVKYYAYNSDWNKVLELTKTNPGNDRLVNFHTNRALYHTGQMTTALFNYPQTWGTHALFLGEIIDPEILMDNSDLFFDLGHISSARHWAYEAQTIYENSPRVLKQLALTNIIIGDYGAAKTVLNILNKSIIHKKWASHYLNCIQNPSVLEKDTLIQNKRKLMTTSVFYMDRVNPDKDMGYILEDNSNNKMAFEYLMSYYLLSNDIISFIKNLKYLRILGYEEIPKIYEEAIMIYITRKDAKRIILPGYKISQSTAIRFESYAKILISYNQDKEAAKNDLYRNYGDSYWYYIHYISPVTNKKELKYITK